MGWFSKNPPSKSDASDAELRAELKRKDDLIEELRKENPTAEQVVTIRRALEVARDKIIEQQKMLGQLTSPPFMYATVVAISETDETQWSPSKGLEKVGTRVRLRHDSKFASQNRSVGTVKGQDPSGWTIVQFDDGYSNHYRTGRKEIDEGACDLEFADPKKLGTAVIVLKGEFFEVLLPKDRNVKPGDTVTIVAETMQIIDVASVQIGGNIGYLRRVIDTEFSEVDYESSVRVVFNGAFAGSLEKGDRVVLDATATVIIRSLGKDDERFSFTAETNVTWTEIGGLTEAKQQMIEAVELPHKNPDLFRFYKKRPIKGVLLYGPPGCGKTMLGKATATALARIYRGGTTSTGFMYIKGPEILDRFVGVAEATIRQIFQRARKHKSEHGYPAVVFIDEADAILAKRGSGVSSDIERTIVPMFLTEMDGLEESGALVILATNRPDILDPAVVRDGRVDRKIKIDRPTPESAAEIFQLGLKQVPLNNGYTCEDLATFGANELFAPKRILYHVRTGSNGTFDFTLGNIVNGGMVMSVVDQATSLALHRDLRWQARGGLRKEDLVEAVNAVERQNRDINHADDLAEFVHDFRDDVLGIQRLRHATA